MVSFAIWLVSVFIIIVFGSWLLYWTGILVLAIFVHPKIRKILGLIILFFTIVLAWLIIVSNTKPREVQPPSETCHTRAYNNAQINITESQYPNKQDLEAARIDYMQKYTADNCR